MGILLFAVAAIVSTARAGDAFRPPAVPLITHDPYFSVWSASDRLTDGWTRHWTSSNQGMCGYAQIDGKSYRFAGPQPKSVPAMDQKSLAVTPTRSIYAFEAAGIEIELTFLSPLLASDLLILSRPVSYVIWKVKAIDGKTHNVSLYLDITGEWAVNTPEQEVVWTRLKAGGMDVLRMGTEEQPILEKKGDNLRIDWGYVYLIVPQGQSADTAIASDETSRTSFLKDGVLPGSDDLRMPRAASDDWPVLAASFNCETVGNEPVSRHLMIAYDDIFSIEYLNRRLKSYWRTQFETPQALFEAADKEFESIVDRCQKFDVELMADLERVGGAKYAQLATLAYRQCLAAHKLAADFDGTPLHFSKECFSNGCIATVDVIYPAAPFSMLFNVELLKGQLKPLLDYSSSKRWPFPFAPHDLGTFPKANGQVYGGGEKTEENQMPVEESGNMLIMLAVLAQMEGNADFANQYWPVVTKWAEFLKEKGLDPANQLCTDDFAGHLAHNSNLSIKAIVALGGFAQLCEKTGRPGESRKYRNLAKSMAKQWMKLADEGDHYRLAFDKAGTWSQKYNLIWDDILDLKLFPKSVKEKEIAYYKKVINTYGLPLDNREKYTKTDWEVWTASLTETPEDFQFFIDPIYKFLNETPDRVPFTDWYWTHEPKMRGFQARSVIGGVFIPMLRDAELWQKWLQRGKR